ncbi:MAG: flagellar basal body-associated FliL family protein [candidate division Zixibacteria bacterium]|nr:flagellar basal body-associated FliL family protein [candidate division Zixibacteria bacterium]
MKPILILVGVVVVMATTAFVVTKLVIMPAMAPHAAETAAPKEEEPAENAEHGAEQKAEVYLVSNLLVNPTGTSGTRYLSASVGIEVKSPAVLEKLRLRDLQVRDLLILVLSSRTVDELTNSHAREQMRREILGRLNQLMGGEQLTAVYFVDYVLQ